MDVLIKNARIIDGTGAKARIGNVGIEGGKIRLNDLPEEAGTVVDAKGKCLTPGFIDAHSHGDRVLGKDFAGLCKLNQGITTDMAGQCGNSQAPFMEASPAEQFRLRWDTYARHVEELPKALNTGLFVGYNTIRVAVMGMTDRRPTAEETARMREHLVNAMEHGAFGMSSGLAYVPGTFATTDDVVDVASAMAPYGGIYTTHMRNESFDLVASVKEALEIGRRAGVAVNISHFKAMGRRNWGSVGQAIAVIEEARAAGQRVTVDQYPYNCSMTGLHPSMPPWYFNEGIDHMLDLISKPEMRAKIRREMEDPDTPYENLYLNAGGWDGITICLTPKTPEAEGLTVQEYAEKQGKDPFDAFFDLLIENHSVASGVYHSIGDDDIFEIIRLPYCMVGTDGIVLSPVKMCHPRGWGSMVHAIIEFTKKRQILSIEELVRKMTGLTADTYGLAGKGYIKEGYDADLVLFDDDRLDDRATYKKPTELAGGVEIVFVGGEAVYREGALTGAMPGKILRPGRKMN